MIIDSSICLSSQQTTLTKLTLHEAVYRPQLKILLVNKLIIYYGHQGDRALVQ